MVRHQRSREESTGRAADDDLTCTAMGFRELVCDARIGEEARPIDLREEAVACADEGPFPGVAGLDEPGGDHVACAGDEAAGVEEEEDGGGGGVGGRIVDVALNGDVMDG